MFIGTHINAALFITPPVFLPETPDFVERERERERACPPEAEKRLGDKEKGRKGERDEGRL